MVVRVRSKRVERLGRRQLVQSSPARVERKLIARTGQRDGSQSIRRARAAIEHRAAIGATAVTPVAGAAEVLQHQARDWRASARCRPLRSARTSNLRHTRARCRSRQRYSHREHRRRAERATDLRFALRSTKHVTSTLLLAVGGALTPTRPAMATDLQNGAVADEQIAGDFAIKPESSTPKLDTSQWCGPGRETAGADADAGRCCCATTTSCSSGRRTTRRFPRARRRSSATWRRTSRRA